MVHLIVNPMAGNGRAARVGSEIAALLREKGVAHTMSLTESAGHATRLAAEAAGQGVRAVVAVGGDGTVCETARGLVGTEAALGVIPAGTGNDIVKMLGIPAKPALALEHFLSHAARPLDAGRINDTLFLNECGTGFDVCVLEHSLSAKKFVRGMLPYLWGIFCAIIAYRPVELTVEVDDDAPFTRKLLLMGVANGRFVGGGMKVAPDALPDDGFFDLVLVDSLPNWTLPFQLPKLLAGRILDIPGASIRRCRRVRVSPVAGEMHLNLDGEMIPSGCATFEMLPGTLKAHW